MNLVELFLRGGLVMWPILLCSVIAVAIILEKFFVLQKAKIDPRQLVMKIKNALHRNDIVSAVEACGKVQAPIARILKRGILKYKEGHVAVKDAIESAGKEEIFHLEKRLGVLANIAGVAPMLGFLGTVTGMIAAFQAIESVGGNVNPSVLAGGIWEAMLTTAAGLFVGIPTLGFYNYFVGKVGRFVFEIETNTEEILDFIKSGQTEENTSSGKQVTISPRTVFADDDVFEPKNDE